MNHAEHGLLAGYAAAAVTSIALAATGHGWEARLLAGCLVAACVTGAWQVTIASRWRRLYLQARGTPRRDRWREN
jgi:hypothetical protein